MKTRVFYFTAEQLRTIHKDHLGFILASSHCCNEITSISPFIIFDPHIDDPTDTERALSLIRFFTLVRLQIVKLFEYRDLSNSYIGAIRKTFPTTAENLGARFGPISRRINSASWARTVRNKVASHFDANYALQALEHVTADHELSFVVARMRGVTAFDFADRILVAAMFFDDGQGDPESGRDVVRKWTLELSSEITKFHAQNMQDIFQQYGLMRNSQEDELRDKYCATPGTVWIPLSTLDLGDEVIPG